MFRRSGSFIELLGRFPERMREPVAPAARAAQTTAADVVERRFVVGSSKPKVELRRMALHAVLVRIRAANVDLLLRLFDRYVFEFGCVEPDVPHPAELGQNGTEHSIIGVAHVAVLFAEEMVTRVTRGERRARPVIRVRGVRHHHMTRPAKSALLGGFEALDVARRGDAHGKHAKTEEKPELGRAHEGWPSHQIDHENDRGRSGASQGDEGERRLVGYHRDRRMRMCIASARWTMYRIHIVMSRWMRGGPWIAASLACFSAVPARADPLRMRADAFADARAPAGLVTLQGQDRRYPWVDAEAYVWGGARSDVVGDVLVLALRLREPHGLGEVRGGRFLFATGAIRPIQIDGVSVLARAPSGLTVEAVGGAPVVPRFGWRAADWLVGGRLAQRFASRLTVGASYVRQNAKEGVANEEFGADLASVPIDWLDVAATGSYDIGSKGVAEARTSAAARWTDWRLELFASHRSPSRLLPATSLFSVLGDFPSQVVGTAVRWNAAPRLDLWVSAAGQDLGGELGGYGSLRSTLRLDDRGDGSVGVEIQRHDIATVHWSGVRVVGAERLSEHFRASSELELARTSDDGRGVSVWPWGLVALTWSSGTGWEAAAATEAGSTPKYRFEVNGLVRVSYATARVP